MNHSEQDQGRRNAVTVSLEELEQCQLLNLVVLVPTPNIFSSLCAIRVSRSSIWAVISGYLGC